MKTATLHRFCLASFGTFGTLSLGEVTVYTVERPWLDNQPFISCISAGKYSCRPRRFFRGGYDAYEVTDVPGRTHILFHKANWPHELAGCIAPNAMLGPGNMACPMRGINSAAAFEKLMEWAGGDPFKLRISE